MHTVNLALRLTLLDLLLRPIGDWFLRPAILGLAAFGVALPGQLRRPWLWIVLALLTLLRVLLNWPMADNHAYLLSYWCLAVALALVSHDPRACLALNARLLVGLAFACATLWKVVLSPDYLDGRFFRVVLLTDRRFEAFAQLAGGLTPELLESLRAFVTQHVDGPFFMTADAPREPTRFLWLTYLMTWWTVLLESLIAVTFLWPFGRWAAQWRNAALLVFCVTTYAVAPVEGFGWLLIAMGVAQCDPECRKTRLLYLAVFLLILLYRDAQWVEQLLEFARYGEVQR
jgi:hypothetical protein